MKLWEFIKYIGIISRLGCPISKLMDRYSSLHSCCRNVPFLLELHTCICCSWGKDSSLSPSKL